MPKTVITSELVKKFRSLVIQSTSSLVTLSDQRVALDIPESVYAAAFEQIFNGDLSLAKDILFGRIENINDSEAKEQIQSIVTLRPAADMITDAIVSQEPLLLISDMDADGSLSQSIAMEIRNETNANLTIQPKIYDPAVHGFGIPQIEDWIKEQNLSYNDPFTVIVTDLGTNQLDVQELFSTMFPSAKLIIVDHHKPEISRKVKQQTPRSLWVSPFTKGSMLLSLRNGGGVSAGYLFYEITAKVLQNLHDKNILLLEPAVLESRLQNIREMGLAANLLDGVQSDTRLKPLHEADVKKAIDLSSLTRSGRSADKWLRDSQPDNIRKLLPIVGHAVVDELLTIKTRYMQQNHYAKALLETIRDVMGGNVEIPDKGGVGELVLRRLSQGSIEESSSVNYLTQLRPWMFNMAYESRISPSVKKDWFDYAKTCLEHVKDVDRQVLSQIRAFELVKELSSEHVLITQPASRDVEQVFSPRELKSAYNSASKSLTMTVSAIYPHKIIMSCSSEESMFELLQNAEVEFPFASLTYQGNNGAGGLVVSANESMQLVDVMPALLKYMQSRVELVRSERMIVDPILVNPIHLPILKEMFVNMRMHIESYAAPIVLLPVDEDTVFEDRRTLAKKAVSELVEGKPWETTTDPLDFSGDLKLMIPNQVLRQMLNQNYDGAMRLTLLPNGHFIASKSVSPSQVDLNSVARLTLPIEREREELIKFYKKHFHNKDLPLLPISAKEMGDAISFVSDGHKVQRISESLTFATLLRTSAQANLVLDVEADGAGNAECINVGLFILERDPKSGLVLTPDEYQQVVKRNPSEIEHFELLSDGNIRVNERLKKSLMSMIIGRDSDRKINVSVKVQALTNFSPAMLDELGMSAEKAQDILLNVFEKVGPFLIQAHNLPYDNNIISVNFPDAYKVMQDNIHLDTAVLAREMQIAYMNLAISSISKVDFYNAPHKGYNLSTLLEDPTLVQFDFPSIKGSHILKVRGDEVSIFNKKTRVTTRLNENRGDVAISARTGMQVMNSPRYSIQLMMRIATIHDLVSTMPIKFVKGIQFNDYGTPSFPESLWRHIEYNYAYDRSVDDNLMLLMQIPELKEFMHQTISFPSLADVPDSLVEARALGTGEMYNPNRTCKTEKDKQEHAKRLLEFSGLYILRANLIDFLNNNPDNAERYAKVWLYDLVLHRHEMTRKNVDKGLLEGLSEELGVPADVLSDIYRDVYRYCDMRGIDSYHAAETHNNINEKGDAPQEKHVFDWMLYHKLSNPYIPREVSLSLLRDPNAPVVDALVKQAARSSMQQLVRKITGVSVDGGTIPINSFSGKQLRNFSSTGISMLTQELDKLAQFKCKSLSEDAVEVRINLPDVDKGSYLQLPEDERQHLEELVELAVTGIVVSNSTSAKWLSVESKTIIQAATAHPAVLEALKITSERFGKMEASTRRDSVKKLMGQLSDMTLGVDMSNLSSNRDIRPEDLNVAHDAFKIAIEVLRQRGYEPFISEDTLEAIISKAKGEFYCNDAARRTGEAVTELPSSETGGVTYPPLVGPQKAAQTRMLTAMSNVDVKFDEISPSFAKTVTKIKMDPISALLQSPLVALAMPSISPGNLKNDLRVLIQSWPESVRAKMNQSREQILLPDNPAESPVNVDGLKRR